MEPKEFKVGDIVWLDHGNGPIDFNPKNWDVALIQEAGPLRIILKTHGFSDSTEWHVESLKYPEISRSQGWYFYDQEIQKSDFLWGAWKRRHATT